MIKCEICESSFIVGTLFCTECGAALFESTKDSISERWQHAHFFILGSGREQRLPLIPTEPILIGRADPNEGYWPQLDLTDDTGAEKGVSRHHALIHLAENNELVLVDKGSVNGTWIDDVRLEPEQPYALPSSGKIRFGGLDVHIFLA